MSINKMWAISRWNSVLRVPAITVAGLVSRVFNIMPMDQPPSTGKRRGDPRKDRVRKRPSSNMIMIKGKEIKAHG